MSVVKQDIVNSSCKVQMCSGQSSGSEAAIHAMRDLFEEEESETVLLVDAANAFNSIDRNAFLHNINILSNVCEVLLQNPIPVICYWWVRAHFKRGNDSR